MATTAQCENTECPEYGVPKDMSLIPPGYSPVFCGACGDEITAGDSPPPDQINNELPEAG